MSLPLLCSQIGPGPGLGGGGVKHAPPSAVPQSACAFIFIIAMQHLFKKWIHTHVIVVFVTCVTL